MLALSRRVGEKIVIGDPANPLGVIQIMAVQGDKVRLAFDFPRDIQINRKELADRMLDERSETDDKRETDDGNDESGEDDKGDAAKD
ncbi:MAG: carbon storage regulator [Algisphaera sp.]